MFWTGELHSWLMARSRPTITIERVCVGCGETKELNDENFRPKSTVSHRGRPRWSGYCLDCDPKIAATLAQKALEEAKAKVPPKHLKAMCTSKRAFKTRKAAENVKIHHALKHRGQQVACYECPFCQKWHITTHPRS